MNNFKPFPKPTKSKKIGREKTWNKIRTKVLKPMFASLNVTYCEVASFLYSTRKISEKEAKQANHNLSFHHRHKRDWYKQFDKKKEEQLLGDHNQVILIGMYYHNMLEHNKELTEQWFMELRGEEIL